MKPNNPIEHVVIIIKENHTFDNYFGTFPGANGVVLPAASDPPVRGWSGRLRVLIESLKDIWQGGSAEYGLPYKGTQFSYGPRVPCLILSPYAKRGINKTFHSHVSIVKFCENTFGLKPLNARDTASDDMSDCFEFIQVPLAAPSCQSS